ncbi:MAG: U32 family peptidase [Gammaproteobacteria bacterium]
MAIDREIDPFPVPGLRLSLGPVLYHWSREVLFNFYHRIARTPVDIVYLGEAVCAKRRALRGPDWIEIAAHLQNAGKQVVLSTLALLESESELSSLRRICGNEKYMVEANDFAAVQLLSGKGPFVTGPSVNIYNSRTLNFLAERGLKRWVMPVELSRNTLLGIQSQRPEGVETEVFVFGRLPLAFSARCFTARAYNLAKDDCQFRCQDHCDGLLLSTRESRPFLVLNGTQTQSARTYSLLGRLDELDRLGVDILRISPQSQHTAEIIELFNACRTNEQASADVSRQAEKFMPIGPCDGYWYREAGMDCSQPGNAAF